LLYFFLLIIVINNKELSIKDETKSKSPILIVEEMPQSTAIMERLKKFESTVEQQQGLRRSSEKEVEIAKSLIQENKVCFLLFKVKLKLKSI
jgi:hypothetical protein